jgi:HPt (histidine-containing phosphotransfer) domain-containing protein
MNLDFLKDRGIDIELGKEFTGGEEKYLSALKRFYKSYGNNVAKLKNYLDSDDISNFTIVVHALKSNSRMVGNEELAKEFESLEDSGKRLDREFIRANADKVLVEYEEFVSILEPVGEAEIKKPADEISGEEARNIISELLNALDDFDDELSAKLVSILSGYPFRTTQRAMLSKADEFIHNFDYDNAAEIIKDICEAIE